MQINKMVEKSRFEKGLEGLMSFSPEIEFGNNQPHIISEEKTKDGVYRIYFTKDGFYVDAKVGNKNYSEQLEREESLPIELDIKNVFSKKSPLEIYNNIKKKLDKESDVLKNFGSKKYLVPLMIMKGLNGLGALGITSFFGYGIANTTYTNINTETGVMMGLAGLLGVGAAIWGFTCFKSMINTPKNFKKQKELSAKLLNQLKEKDGKMKQKILGELS